MIPARNAKKKPYLRIPQGSHLRIIMVNIEESLKD
jgi:hypothetical protein